MGALCSTFCSKKSSTNQTISNVEGYRSNPTRCKHFRVYTHCRGKTEDINVLRDEWLDAVKQCNESMLMYYLTENPFVDLRFKDNQTMLHLAVKYKIHCIVEHILHHKMTPINEQNSKNGDTAFHIASRNGDMQTIKLLKQYNADANIENFDDETPLSIAREYEYDDIMNELDEDSNQCPAFLLSLDQKLHIGNMADSVLLHSPDIDSPANGKQLGYVFTAELTCVVSDLVDEVERELNSEKRQLKFLSDWIYKRSNGLPYNWMKRWMVIKDGFLLYSDRQIHIKDRADRRERRRWSKSIRLVNVIDIEPIHGKQKEFRITVDKEERSYVFKTQCMQTRDLWVDSLRDHIRYYKLATMFRKKVVGNPKNESVFCVHLI